MKIENTRKYIENGVVEPTINPDQIFERIGTLGEKISMHKS